MMKENSTVYKMLLIVSTVVSIGSVVAYALLRHDTADTLRLALSMALILLAGWLVLWFPGLAVNYRPRRVDGRWRTSKQQVVPNLFGGIAILIAVLLIAAVAFLQ